MTTFKREPVQIVEIDLDFCLNTFGSSPCTATLGGETRFKCFNGWKNCADKPNYSKGTLTLRFINQISDIPKDGNTYFPVLKSVKYSNETVNIGSGDDKLGTLGKRGNSTVVIEDFFHNFRGFDKYADQRRDGTAQADGNPIDPSKTLTFWNAFKLRHPNYADRPIRVINTFIEEVGGKRVFSSEKYTRHYVIGSIKGPSNNSSVTIKAKDILTLTDKKTAIAPKVSEGSLKEDIDENATSLILTPSGVGDEEYPTSGFATLGSEIVEFTRSGDTVTLIQRAVGGSELSGHSADDTFQLAIRYDNVLVDYVLNDLLNNYTTTPSEWIDSVNYNVEAERWGSTMKLNTFITEPTPVKDLLGELAALGVSIWSESANKRIRMRLNHPRDFTERVTDVTDNNLIKTLEVDDRDEDRITQVHFYSVQKDVTEKPDDKGNYNRALVTLDADAQNENFYSETRIKEILSRWFNQGNDAAIRIMSRRLLQRFNKAPVTYTIIGDWQLADQNLVDLLMVQSSRVPDVEGRLPEKMVQIISKDESKFGHEVVISAQDFEFKDNLSFIMPNTAVGYNSTPEGDKEPACFIIAEANERFPDGRLAYAIM